MENLNQAIVDGAHVVARAVEFHVRQAATSAISSATSAPTPGPTPSDTGLSSMMMPSMTSPAASPSPSATENKDGGGGGSNSPLLFFVALGFGVVFTNLWIIVGIKYCFRYNARNRAMARVDENGEPIDLQNMPARPHRRRREKKLMTMDEVNEKFPMVKYKTWVLERKREGLPTTGGISAPPSRAGSVRSVEGIVPEQPSDTREITSVPTVDPPREPVDSAQGQPKPNDKEDQKSTDTTSNVTPLDGADKVTTTTNEAPNANTVQTETQPTKDSLHRASEDDEEDEDDHINPALDPDMMGSSGDTCAICIDTLEDDDDVRGLTCGHAFHAVCLDPWLTNRRACCPLCKADYYTPKARPQPVEGEIRDPHAPSAPADPARNNDRMNYPRTPVRSFAWSHFRDAPRQMFPSRFNDAARDPGQVGRDPRSGQPMQAGRRSTANRPQQPAVPEETGGNFVTRFRNRFPPFQLDRVVRNNREARAAGEQSGSPNTGVAHHSTTPSQLEAGVRSPTTRTN